jgi:hypothetical protein
MFPSPLFGGFVGIMPMRYPEWSPDGKRIVYEFNESKGNIFLAELP